MFVSDTPLINFFNINAVSCVFYRKGYAGTSVGDNVIRDTQRNV